MGILKLHFYDCGHIPVMLKSFAVLVLLSFGPFNVTVHYFLIPLCQEHNLFARKYVQWQPLPSTGSLFLPAEFDRGSDLVSPVGDLINPFGVLWWPIKLPYSSGNHTGQTLSVHTWRPCGSVIRPLITIVGQLFSQRFYQEASVRHHLPTPVSHHIMCIAALRSEESNKLAVAENIWQRHWKFWHKIWSTRLFLMLAALLTCSGLTDFSHLYGKYGKIFHKFTIPSPDLSSTKVLLFSPASPMLISTPV